jgi:hypothetical protein
MSEPNKGEDIDPDWLAISQNNRRAMLSAWVNGMPTLSSAVYARWWQLEVWLRSLVYVELRSERGAAWADALPKRYESRQLGEIEFRYMETPDSQNLLAYTDASTLFKITVDRWELFKHALLSKNVWAGRIEELIAIRNRISHCRRPLLDDLVRLEQTLRDLNGGAFQATSAFNNQSRAEEIWTDVLVDGWVRNQHEDAVRLVEHARRQYDTTFELRYSRRPWAIAPVGGQTISGVSGYIWHAFWYFRGGSGFDLIRFWSDIKPYAEHIFLVCADSPSSLSVSFSAMDDPAIVADAIGHCFDSAISSIGRDFDRDTLQTWQSRYADLDPRVHLATPWAMVDESMRGVSIFSA